MEELQKYFSDRILHIERLDSKIKNNLFKISTINNLYFLKKYSSIKDDKWDRGKTEFTAINNLWNMGFREIPRPITFYDDDNIGIYSFEKGETINVKNVNKDHILKIVDFLVKLHGLGVNNKKQFPLASRACLSLNDYFKFIDDKIKFIDEGISKQKNVKGTKFFYEIILPKVTELKTSYLNKGLNLDKKLPIKDQVLAFTDFGFHNILINNEDYKFIDFEYFGRDDPAKEILLFIHHPQSKNIKPDLKKLFLEEYAKRTDHLNFLERINLIEPLIKMIWIIVNLNVLSQKYMEHFKFSHEHEDDEYFEKLIDDRVKESEEMLERL